MKTTVLVWALSFLASVASAQEQVKVVKLTSATDRQQKAILAQVGDGAIDEIEHVFDKGVITYEVEMTTKDGQDRDFTIAADGTLLSVEVSPSDVPPVVQKTIKAQLGQGKLDTIEKSIDDDGINYDVTMITKDGQDPDFTVSDKGKLVSLEVVLAETPAPVLKTITAQVAQGKLDDIEKNFEDDGNTYQVSFTTKNGLERSFTLGEDGTLESREVTLAETPKVVQDAVATEVGKGTVQDVDEILDPDGVTYEIAMSANANGGRYRNFVVAADGHLDSREVDLANTPKPVQATISAQIGNGKVIRIDRSFVEKAKGVFPFEVQGEKDGKPFDFSVGPGGRFLGLND